MSGGSYNYIYNTLSEECEGYMHDEEMNTLIKDLCKVLHDLEWWQSCDISEEDYRKTVAEFKEKYFPDSAKTDTAKPKSDLISRTQAINDYAQCFADEYGMDCGEMFIGVLHQCPTFPDLAENKGHWKVGFGNTWCSCSECSGNGSTNWSYCPWCGADMRGEQ